MIATKHKVTNLQLSKLLPPIHWNDYIPVYPSPKQLVFLSLERNLEVFYGGAAAGGKTAALCMAALQFVHIPTYSCIIFRKNLSDLALENSPMDILGKWLSGTDARFNGRYNYYSFPSGAKIQMGYMGEQRASNRYKSAEFQAILWDEVSEQTEDDYRYMFTRLRKCVCPIHGLKEELDKETGTKEMVANYIDGCESCSVLKAIPLRVRAASNPPRVFDPGLDWLEKRFDIRETVDDEGRKTFKGHHPTRVYIPANIRDNPHVNQKAYIQSLDNVDPVTREQMLLGYWGVYSEGRFKRAWVREYRIGTGGEHIVIYNENGSVKHTYHVRELTKIQTCDPAASIREGPGDKDIYLNKRASSSVLSTFYMTPTYDLLWVDCEIWNEEIPDVVKNILSSYRRHRPTRVYIEANGLGIGVFQTLDQLGINVQAISPLGLDKLVRATQAIVRMEQGRIFFPRDGRGEGITTWREQVDRQVFNWIGHKEEPSDIVDTLSYAAIVANEMAGEYDCLYEGSMPECI